MLKPYDDNRVRDKDELFAINLTDAAKTHDEWLKTVRFGLGRLKQDSSLLIEIIINRAYEEKEESNFAAYAAHIFLELDLEIE